MSVRAPVEPPATGGYPQGSGGQPGPSKSGARGSLVLIVVAVLAAAVLFAAAMAMTRSDSGEDKRGGTPDTSVQAAPVTVATTVDPQAAIKAEVIAGYRAGWDAHLAVGRDPTATADDDRLRAHLTGDTLAVLQLHLVKIKSAEEVYIGEVRLNPKVLELDGTTATIEDCVDDATGTVDAATGKVVQAPNRVVKLATVTMKLVGGVWKISNYKSVEASCVPAAS